MPWRNIDLPACHGSILAHILHALCTGSTTQVTVNTSDAFFLRLHLPNASTVTVFLPKRSCCTCLLGFAPARQCYTPHCWLHTSLFTVNTIQVSFVTLQLPGSLGFTCIRLPTNSCATCIYNLAPAGYLETIQHCWSVRYLHEPRTKHF